MHPVLLRIPLPLWDVPLGPALVLLVLAALVIAELGRRGRAWDLVVLGLATAAAAAVGAARFRGQSVALEPIPLYGFGVFLSAGLLGGWGLTLRLAERDGLPREVIAGCYFATAVCGLVGARVLYVLTNLADFGSPGDVLAFRSGGLVFYGGVIGGFVGSLVYLRQSHVPWLAWADVAAPSLALGSLLGRVGCFLAGCDYGVPLGAGAPRWLARLGTFPRWPDDLAGAGAGSPAWVDHVLHRGLSLDSVASLPVHPTQLYESVAVLLLLAGLLALRGRRAFQGQIFFTFVAGYGALRFLLEVLRDDPERGLYGPRATPAVLVSVGLLVLAAAFLIGPSRALARPRFRSIARAVALATPVFAYVGLRAGHGAPTALSTSQWIALSSSLAVGAAWRLGDGASRARAADA